MAVVAPARPVVLLCAIALIGAAPPPQRSGSASIADLVQVTDISGLTASPDGQTIAFRTERAALDRNSYALTWHAVDLGKGRARNIGGGGAPIYAEPGIVQTEAPVWSPDGRSIYYRALVDEAVGVWRAHIDGSGSAAAIVGDADVESLEAAPDGRALFYRAGPSRDEIERAEAREYDDGILVDPSVETSDNSFRGGAINGRMASQRLIGYWSIRAGLLWKAPRQRRRYDLMSRSDTPVGVPEPVPAFEFPEPGVSASARSAAGDVAQASWDGMSGSLRVRRAGETASKTCGERICSSSRIAALVWRPRTQELLVTFADRHHRQSLYLWDVASDAMRMVVEGEGLLSGARRSDRPCAVTPKYAVCVAAAAISPPRVDRIDLDSGARDTLYDPNQALRAGLKARVEQLSWTSAGGAQNSGTLLLPSLVPARRLPLFINYYRCEGFLRGGEGDEWPAPSMLDAGFAVACLNSAPASGPQDALATYEAGLESVRSFIAQLDRRALVDPRRVAMGGFSFGAEVTAWVAMRSDLLAAGSIASTLLEPSDYWSRAVRGRDQTAVLREVWGLGPPDETPDRWKLVSPARNVARIKAPLLLQMPEREARKVSELYARLTHSSTPAELYVYPQEAHIKIQPRHKLSVYRRNLDWFRYWLQGYVDPDPAKAAQYRRWNLLAKRRAEGASSSP